MLRYLRGHAGVRRPLVAEHVARRHARTGTGIQMDETALPILLVDLAAREGVLDAGGAHGLLADGPARGRVPGAQRPRQPAGSLGGGARLLAVHRRRRDRGAPCRGRPRRRGRGRRRRRATCARRRTPGTRSIERWLYVSGHRPGAAARRRWLLRAGRAAGRADAASPRDGFVPIKNRPPDQSRRVPRPRSSASTRSPWSASACAPRTIRASSARSR